MAGQWTQVTTPVDFNAGTMLLLTDGSVMCHQTLTSDWKRLATDHGAANPSLGYVNGIWTNLAPLPPNPVIPANKGGPTNAPLYFYSAVLADGCVFVTGGEYNGNIADPAHPFADADLTATQIYDPVVDSWSIVVPPGAAQAWASVGDAPGCVLEDGRVLLGSIDNALAGIFDPASGTWIDAGAGGAKHDSSSEETWTLLANGSVLVAECNGHNAAERYDPGTDTWLDDGPTAGDLVEAASKEIGPAILLPDGRVFAIGATGLTNLYTPGATVNARGSWVLGPNLPQNPIAGAAVRLLIAKDAPAALLPNGRVLFSAGPGTGQNGDYLGPTFFFEFDPLTSRIALVPGPWDTTQVTDAPYEGRMLLLPTGDVLYSSRSGGLAMYTPDGTADVRWMPAITSAPLSIKAGGTGTVLGTQLNGLSQAVAYGDDASMATNYPIVSLTVPNTQRVVFARSFGFSTMRVATGARVVSAQFSLPNGVAPGRYDLRVTANGISSLAWPINVTV